MAVLMRYFCSIDGLEIDTTGMLGWFSDYMASAPVPHELDFQTDNTIVCPNGHHWAINFKVEVRRVS